jgi:glycosyltransferase involved in cell wall biosynthesis
MPGFNEPEGAQPVRIAQVCPLYESVPPKLYGGTERVVSYLTEALIELGHDVTLFASGDSRSRARLVPVWPRAMRLDSSADDPMIPHLLMFERVAAQARDFDIIHFHTDYLHFPVARRLRAPMVTTLHGRLDLPRLAPVYCEFSEMRLISISADQRGPMAWANWAATVHHGLPPDLLRAGSGRLGYFAFLGRISPEKRPDLAIRIAREAGVPLKIAAKVDRADQEYFEREIRPLLNAGDGVEFVGEIGEGDKGEFLGGASAMLFPIDWPEPFGLVMLEAMACGTPVIAFRRGSVPEVIEDGVTGFIVDGAEEAVSAVGRVRELDRTRIRARFEERFTAERMARDYVEVYASEVRAAREGPEPGRMATGRRPFIPGRQARQGNEATG